MYALLDRLRGCRHFLSYEVRVAAKNAARTFIVISYHGAVGVKGGERCKKPFNSRGFCIE